MQNYGSYACVNGSDFAIPGNGTGGPWIHTNVPYCCNYLFVHVIKSPGIWLFLAHQMSYII